MLESLGVLRLNVPEKLVGDAEALQGEDLGAAAAEFDAGLFVLGAGFAGHSVIVP